MASLIDAPRGADLLLSYIFPDGTDLTGYAAAFTVYGERNGTRLLSANMTPNGNGSALSVNGNLLSLVVRATDIDALPINADDATQPAFLWFDLIVTTTAPDVCKLYGGLMRVLPFGAQITPQGGTIEVCLDGQVVLVEVASSGFDTALLALAEGYAGAAQAGAAAAASEAGIATAQAAAAAGSAGTANWAATAAVQSQAAAAQSATDADGFAQSAAQSAANALGSQTAAGSSATTASGAAVSASATAASLSSLLSTSIVLRPLAPESGYVFAALDANQRASFAVGTDGSFYAFKYAANSIAGPALMAGAVTTAALADTSVTFAKLDTATVGSFLPKVMAPESGYVWGVADAASRMALGIGTDGTVTATKLSLPAGSVDFPQLTANLTSYVAKPLSPESGYVWGVVDATGRMGLGLTTAGTVVGDINGTLTTGAVTTPVLANGAVTEAKLDPMIDRLAVPHVADVVEVLPDKWRAQYGTIAARSSIDGTGWTRLPHTLTRGLRGKNLSGTALQFRKTAGLAFRGLRDGGAWNPNANATLNSTHYLGNMAVGFTTANFTSSPSTGSYYRCIGLTATAFDGQSCLCGDLIVYNGATWKAQLAPRYGGVQVAPQNGRLEGDFYEVTTAGTFDGVAYAAGDKIVHIGFDSLSGSGQPLWTKGNAAAGELFYKGTFTPGTTSLAGAVIGDVYQASAAGSDSTSGLTFAVADYAVFDHYAVWGNVPSAAITTVAANAMIPGLSCVMSANEWEFRRADTSATVIGVAPTIQHQSAPRRSVDSVLLLSDSMFGVPNVQGQLQPLVAPRTVNLITRGGGTSRNVMSTYEWYIATQADPYKGEFTFLWQGQNNQPVTVGDANWCQVIETALELRNLFGARDRRFCFLSILGVDQMTFDGTQIHVTQHEAMFAGAAQGFVLWELEQWYAAMFPGQWLSPRQVLLAAAATSTILDARVPGSGMTEAATALAHGWVPFSYWNPPAGGWPIPLGALSLQGYWNANSLPTGGANGQAYTISGGTLGNVGNLIINVAGTWGVYAADQTHQGAGANQGGQYLAAALANYLSSNLL